MSGNARLVFLVAFVGLLLGFTGGYLYVNQQIQAITMTSSAMVEAANRERSIFAEQATGLQNQLAKQSRELAEVRSRIQDTELALRQARADNSVLQDSLMKLQSERRMLADEVEKLAGQVQSVRGELADVNTRLARARRTLDSIEGLIKNLESDRDLLVELRKSAPTNRQDAEAYWAKVKTLAARVDPALAVAVEKIRGRIDAYFDWIEARPPAGATLEELALWVFSAEPAVFEYNQNIEDLTKNVFLNMILRIDTAENILAR